MRRTLLAMVIILMATNPAAWGQGFDRQTLLGVLLATDARQVAACQRLGNVSDTSPEDLRKKILRAGGNAGLVTFDPTDPDKMNAEVYRCQPAAAPAAPPAVAPGDPESVQRMLLGTWSGTLSSPPVPVSAPQGPSAFPATVRMTEEGGQLRWRMEVGNRDLDASGTVKHFFAEVTLTGTYGSGALPITYSLRLRGPTLEGSGVGPDQVVRTLSLRKQP